MAKQEQANQEPSIEEILDSIRQIIADDEESPAPPEVPPAPAPDEPEDDVIELTERADAAPPAPVAPPPEPERPPIQVDMRDSAPEPEPEPEPLPPPPPPPRIREVAPPVDDLDGILTKRAEDSIMGAMDELTRRATVERGGEVTVEDIVREEIRPMLRAWIDRHVPALVEKLLRKELEKISRRFEEE